MTTTMPPKVDSIQVGFHYGNIIAYLSHLYGNGLAFLKEAVQNSIDEGATKIYIFVNCQRQTINVYDNGNGAAREEITRKFNNIGWSLKSDDSTKMGQKGIGNLAGLAIAKKWQFFSRKNGPIWAYLFEREQLKKATGVQLQAEQLNRKLIDADLVWANSLLKLLEVDETILKQLGDQESIERGLRETFNTKLRIHNIDLRVRYTNFAGKTQDFVVKPVKFRGSALTPVKYDTGLGEVEFHFYHNPVPLSRPSMLVLHQGKYSIHLSNFFKKRLLPQEVEEYFFKGYFEGEIRLGYCTINPQRDAFIADDHLKIFAAAIKQFALEVLRPYVDQFEQSDREERWKKIAADVIKKLKAFFRDHPKSIPPELKTVVFGKGDQGVAGVGLRQKKEKKNKVARSPLEKDALKEKKEEAERERASGVKKAAPKSRVVEFADGLGIVFFYPNEEEDGFLWHSRIEGGVIQVNVANPVFLEVEKRGQQAVAKYITHLLHIDLTAASLNPMNSAAFKAGSEQMLSNYYLSTL